ncbi:hypothetical protein AAVH_33669, partial [Aphelenchoides avenae]
GPSIITEPCDTTPCTFPKKSCCSNYSVKPLNGKIVCVGTTTPPPEESCSATTEKTTPAAQSSCCGTWSEWTESSSCPA